MIEGILIKGPLTEEDAKEFGETMRKVEQKRPNETFLMTIINELSSNTEAVALLNTVYPAIQGRPYDVKQFHKTDEGRHEEIAQKESLGATGQYPRGSTGPHDEGELKIAAYIDQDRLFLNFGKFLSWMAMTKEEALIFGMGIVQKAKEMP